MNATTTVPRKLTAVCVDDEFGPFPALVRTDTRWNGWAVAIFPMDSVKLIKAILENSDQDPDAANIITIDDEGVWELCTSYRDEHPDSRGELVPTVDVDGVTYYAVGDGWCWSEATVFCGECEEEFDYADIVDLTRVGIDPCMVFMCKACMNASDDECMMQGCHDTATVSVNWVSDRFDREEPTRTDRRCAEHAKQCASGQPDFGRYNIQWGDGEVTITYNFTQADEEKFLAAFPQHAGHRG